MYETPQRACKKCAVGFRRPQDLQKSFVSAERFAGEVIASASGMVPESAVVVWQVRGIIEDVHCFFYPKRAGFALAVERAGERLLDEMFDHFPSLMARAREMKRTLIEVGFEPVEEAVDAPGLEWLLHQFVRRGVASLHPHAPRAC